MRRRSVVGLAAGLVLVLGLQGSATQERPDGFVGALTLTSKDPLFGGLSAIDVSGDGTGFVAISDRGATVRGHLERSAQGRLIGATLGPMIPMKRSNGRNLSAPWTDSEGLAVARDGAIFISFENKARIERRDRLDGPAVAMPQNPAFALLPHNGGLEALAIDDEGTIYAIPERPPRSDRLPVHVLRGGAWRAPLYLQRSGGFDPVAADFGPDGRLYLLERRFHGYRGFSSRLRRFDRGVAGFSSGQTLLETAVGLHDNLEGLSVWRSADGLRATMISDDNFFALQITEIVEYGLPD